jgi:hypothetical protein
MDMEDTGRRKLRRRNRWADVLAAIILCCALVLSVIALRDYMRSKLLNYTTVEDGSITLTLPAELMVLRHEYVLAAPVAGPFLAHVEEGARVREGSLIGYCGSEPVYAQKGGAVSYILDGWEGKLQINSLHQLNWLQVFAQLKEELSKPAKPVDEEEPALRPVARVVDNLLDYTALLMLEDPREILAEESRITFKLPEGHTISADYQERWQDETVAGKTCYYIFNKISSREDILFSLRYSEVEIIAREVSGVIVPSTAITMDEDGRAGVFIRKKRKLVFTEIEELAVKDDISVVSGLDGTAVVVTNPSRARDGQRI